MIKKMVISAVCLIFIVLSLHASEHGKKNISSVQQMQAERDRMRQQYAQGGNGKRNEPTRKTRVDNGDYNPVVKINPQPVEIGKK